MLNNMLFSGLDRHRFGPNRGTHDRLPEPGWILEEPLIKQLTCWDSPIMAKRCPSCSNLHPRRHL